MYKAPYFTADGTQQGERDLPSWLFDGEVNQAVMHQVVTALRANRRQGTGAAKNRAAVAGGTRKPWRQKGTGRARAGTTRAAQWVGGGRAFPPQPHSWRRDIPRKVKVLARHSAFNVQAADGRVILVERFDDSEPKTGRLVSALEALGAGDKRVLLLTEGGKTNLYLSGRNLARVEVRPFGEESAYDVLLAGSVVIEVGALDSGSPTVIDGGRRSAKKRTAIEKEGESEAIAAEQAAAEARVEVRKARMAERAARKLSRRIRPGQEARVHASPVKPKKAVKAKVKDAPAAEERAAVEVATEQVAAVEAKATGDAPLPKVGELAAYLAGLTEVAEVEALRARDKRKTAQAHYDRRVAKLTEGGADD